MIYALKNKKGEIRNIPIPPFLKLCRVLPGTTNGRRGDQFIANLPATVHRFSYFC
jgi:hypothetical protein